MPFIDIVAGECRENIKQQLLDYQHKTRVRTDTHELEISELLFEKNGKNPANMMLHATFDAVEYDGEDCLQVVLRDRHSGDDGGTAGEGLRYPVFLSHLDTCIRQACECGDVSGHLLHIQGGGFQYYMTDRGYGALNAQLKLLSSTLKGQLQESEYRVRFTENSFLLLLREHSPDRRSSLVKILKEFSDLLNSEISSSESQPVRLEIAVIPVGPDSVSAEALINTCLTDKMDKTDKEQDALDSDSSEENSKIIPFVSTINNAESLQLTDIVDPQSRSSDNDSRQETGVGTSEAGCNEEDSASSIQPSFTQAQISNALSSGMLSLFFRPVISVTEIETEFYDISLYIQGAVP